MKRPPPRNAKLQERIAALQRELSRVEGTIEELDSAVRSPDRESAAARLRGLTEPPREPAPPLAGFMALLAGQGLSRRSVAAIGVGSIGAAAALHGAGPGEEAVGRHPGRKRDHRTIDDQDKNNGRQSGHRLVPFPCLN